MLFKEDVEQSLKKVLTEFSGLTIDGDTVRALTELYNSLPSSEVNIPVRGLLGDELYCNYTPTCGEHLTTRDELQDLADELNKVKPIDWRDRSQAKYSINLDSVNKELGLSYTYRLKGLNIYSTNEEFLKKAKERIGEERLIKLFKEGI